MSVNENIRIRGVAAAAAVAAVALVAALLPATTAFASEAPPAAGEVIEVDSATRTIDLVGDATIALPGSATSTQIDTAKVPEHLLGATAGAVLSTDDRGSTITSYPTDDGVQTLIEIPSAAAPAEYRFPIGLPEGGQAALFDDGSVVLSDANGTAIGGFRTPWAIAADGAAIPTSFRIEGGELVQTVEFSTSTAFPVIADPDFGSEWWGWYVQLTNGETKEAAGFIAQGAGADKLSGFLCGVIGGPVGIACGAAVVIFYFRITEPIERAARENRCAALNLPWATLNAPTAIAPHVTVVECRR